MSAKKLGGFGEDLKEKGRELGWWVLVALLRWLLERLTHNPGDGGDDGNNR